MTVKKALLCIVAPWILLALALFGPHFWWVATDKDYYGWPAVTKCRICDKTVWMWQSYSRRAIPVEMEDQRTELGPIISVSCSMSGLMHDSCKGTPKPAKVSVSND